LGVCQVPSSNPTKTKNGCGPGLGEFPKILGSPFNIFATAKASDFKFGTHLGFAKTHHKITPRGKGGCGRGLGDLPKILGFPFNISATAEASDFKFGTQLGFAMIHHKITPRGKWMRPWAMGAPQNFKLPFNKFGTQIGFAKTHHKITPSKKVGAALG